SPNLSLALADWGSLSVLSESTSQSSGFVPASQGSVTALVVHVDADHLGFARGSTIRIGFAEASGHVPQPTATTTTSPGPPTPPPAPPPAAQPTTGGPKSRSRPQTAPPPPPGAGPPPPARGEPLNGGQTHRRNGLPVRTTIPDVTPRLTAGRYVF